MKASMLPADLNPFRFAVGKISAALMCLGSGLSVAEEAVKAPEHPGAAIYRRMCVDCHGKQGEGVAGKYDDTLSGNRSVSGLARLISKTMPEGKEGTCTGADAEAVASYIYDAFYSPAAQARIRPVQESLSHLTVAQYQNSVADLIGRFRPGFDRPPAQERGLRVWFTGVAVLTPEEEAEYKEKVNEAQKTKKDKPPRKEFKFDRIDSQVAVHFGAESPNPKKMVAEEFRANWAGSVMAPETGLYEFVAKTENGVRVYVNNSKDPIIDAWVSTGAEVRDEKKSLFLIGGRSYRLAVEFLKYKDKSASLELWWKTPHGNLELIPQSRLMPQEVRPNMVVTTAIPADDRSDGYERGTSVSKEWEQATTAIAIEVSDHVDADLDGLAGTKPGAPDRLEKLKNFSRRFAETAFRRPLSEDQKAGIVDRAFEKAPTPGLAVKRVVLHTLKSPQFIYPELSSGEKVDDFTVASRLALTLWDSIPDAALTKAASEGRLKTREQLEKEVKRMVADQRCKAKLNGFFQVWLDLEKAEHASKDASLYPEFTEEVRADLRQSLALFLDEVVWGEKSDYRQLLQADYLWLNDRLSRVYGKPVEGASFQKVSMAEEHRSGVLTHPYLLSAFAYSRTSSPIHRGVFLSRSIVGVNLKNPSIAAAFEDAKFDPSLTMREKVTSVTKNASCAGCHSVINPLGFTLEHFDSLGRWRTEDNHKPVDSVVDFDGEEGGVVKFSGAVDVANHAVKSAHAHEAFVRQLFHYVVKQPPGAFGSETLERLKSDFAANEFNIRKLLGRVVLTKVMDGMTPESPKVAGAN
ncbi:MAG: DUF1592 domain-containing protein [Verrucomicrobiota bacterium]